MLENITNGIIIAILFSACIFVHELGHFLSAVWRGLRVEEFAIGFGPKIWGFTREWTDRRGRKQKTLFRLNWIPFGGYVKLPQVSVLDEKHLAEYDPPLTPVSPLDKIVTVVAGPLFNIGFGFALAAVVMVIGMPVDKSELDLTIGYVSPHSIEAKGGLQRGDRIVAVNGKRVSDWMSVKQAVAFSLGHQIEITVEREGKLLNVFVAPERLPVFKLRRLSVGPKAIVTVVEVKPDTPAARVRLQRGDKILQVDGIDVVGSAHLLDLIGDRAGKQTTLLIQRGEEKFTVPITPRLEATSKRGKIGIVPGDWSDAGTVVLRPSPLKQVKEVLIMMSNTLALLLHPRQSGVTPGDMSGPIGIAHSLWVTIKAGLVFALGFMVLINVNLAIINLLPIPVLDGGHVGFAILEAIRRRPLNYRLANAIQTGFAMLIIGFFIYITYNDILRWLHIRQMQAPQKLEFIDQPPADKAPVDEAPAPQK